MRVLYFTRDYTTHDRRFLSGLAQTGHQVFYLRLERRGHVLEERPLPDGIESIDWAGGKSPARWGDGPRLLDSLREVITRLQPDLIQAGPIQTAALLVALTGFQPLVSMSWGSDLLKDADRNAWQRWATYYVLRRSAVMVGDCDPVRHKARLFGLPDERIVTFPWGVDLEHFQARREPGSDLDKGRFTFLSTRSWEPVYGVDVIAQAFVQAARQSPALRLVMLGNGSQADLLRSIFKSGGVEEQVFFPGQVRQEELPDLYGQADIYLSASHSDGTSISLLEALACGRPALLSDIPGNREWIQPEVEGWFFADGDAGALAQGMLKAVEQYGRLPEMGRAARRLAEARANWHKNFQGLLQAYDIAMSAEKKVSS